MKRGGSKKDGRELILTAELPWGRKAVRQGTPEMCKEKKKKKALSREILVKKELMLLSKHPSSYHR